MFKTKNKIKDKIGKFSLMGKNLRQKIQDDQKKNTVSESKVTET
jgi:hypothetical protein